MKIIIFISFLVSLNAISQTDSSQGRVLYNEVFCLCGCETDAEFENGKADITSWVQSHFIYPDQAIKNDEKGKLYALFIIDENGSVNNVEIEKGISNTLDNEVLKLLRKMPNWTPASYGGQNLITKMQVCFEFKLM